MKLIAYIYIHNFFLTAAHWSGSNTDITNFSAKNTKIADAVIKNNHIIDSSARALKKGVIPGLTKRQALCLCPGLVLTEFDTSLCQARTEKLARYCYALSPKVEVAAENEIFIDLSGNKIHSTQTFKKFIDGLIPYLGTYATVSLAPCRLLAKAAALLLNSINLNKYTAGIKGLNIKKYEKFCFCMLKPETQATFLSNLPVDMMWPLDSSTIKQLKTLGIKSFTDIEKIPYSMLQKQFGSLAPIIEDYSRGIDKTCVPFYHPQDSISITYHTNCENTNAERLKQIFRDASVYISKTLAKQGKNYHTLTMVVFFENHSIKKTSSFNKGKHDMTSIYNDSLNLLNKFKIDEPITGLSLTAGRLKANTYNQILLFEDPKTLNGKINDNNKKLTRVYENLAAKYTPGIVSLGSTLTTTRREQMLMFVDPFRREN